MAFAIGFFVIIHNKNLYNLIVHSILYFTLIILRVLEIFPVQSLYDIINFGVYFMQNKREFTGTVIDVPYGDSLVVSTGKEEITIHLNNVRAPR